MSDGSWYNPVVHATQKVSQIIIKSQEWMQVVLAFDYDSSKGEWKKAAVVELKVTKDGDFIMVMEKNAPIKIKYWDENGTEEKEAKV